MKRIGVFTSGGDAPGMNAAVRAVVRMGLDRGTEVYAIYEGYQGMVDGGGHIRPMGWNDVGGILHQGGTIIGSARSKDFQTREGRRQAALNLIQHGINHLVCIGGDGSLTGAQIFFEEWPSLLEELFQAGMATSEQAAAYPHLFIAGLVGSIDNDMAGTDITIGADTALHRITDAVDAISSTAASHQRAFVVEVMGRHCGYLALMGALASGADWVLIPESPPDLEDWETRMCSVLAKGRETGRRDSIVVVAEGACDQQGKPITSDHVKRVLEEQLGEDTRVTILGHVQRGGSPSAFDRNLATLLGAAAVEILMAAEGRMEPVLVGLKGNRIVHSRLKDALEETREIAEAIAEGNYERAMDLRGSSFKRAFRTLRTLIRSLPRVPEAGRPRRRIAVLNAGAPAPGMNTAVRAVVRVGLDRGHLMVGIRNGFRGLVEGDISPMDWMSVNGWAPQGGSELGTNRYLPEGADFYTIARHLEEHAIEGVIMIGGWSGYQAILELHARRNSFPAFNIPIVCMPATIDNDLPAAELSVGADTALNSIIDAVDKIKRSAVASRRVFVVEVMGAYCGYLALMSALASGAERVYLPEEGVTLADLEEDVQQLRAGFMHGKRLGVMIRNEYANHTYSTAFMSALFEEEGGDLFDVRTAILGHLQQGGNPMPFDRILATLMAPDCVEFLEEQIGQEEPQSASLGLVGGGWLFTDLQDLPRLMDNRFRRPKQQWWLGLRPIAAVLAQPGPNSKAVEEDRSSQ